MSEHDLPLADDDRPDPRLRRALDHAPDHSTVPDFRIGKRIRSMAHAAVAPETAQDLLPMLPEGGQPWWRRLLFGSSAGRSNMPWNAAFATVLVGVLVTVLWQREPVPGPQLDSQAPAKAKAPTPPAAPAPASSAPPVSPTPAPSQQADASAAKPRIALPPTVTEAPALPGPPTPPVVPTLPFQLKLPPAPPAAARKSEQAESLADQAERKRVEAARPSPSQAAQQAVPAPPAPSTAPQSAAPAPGAPAAALSNRAAGAAAANAPAESVSELPPQPTFAALTQWTRMTITGPGGESRSFARADARELGALLGSAAITAVSPQPLRNKVEWRVTLERDGKPLARFELARGEVRWRENGLPPATGLPPEGALDGLRDALREAAAQQALPQEPAPAPEAPR